MAKKASARKKPAKQAAQPATKAATEQRKFPTFQAAAGLRTALDVGTPGNWATDHRAEADHIKDWVYIAIRAACLQAMQASVNVFDDSGPTGQIRKSHRQHERGLWRESPSLRMDNRPYWKRLASLYGKSLYGQESSKTTPLPEDSRVVKLMRKPNPSQAGAMFRYEQVLQLQATGTCIVWNVPNNAGVTVERYVIPTGAAYPVAPTTDYPNGGYRVDPSSSRWRTMADTQGFVEMSGYFSAIGHVIPVEQCQVIRWPHPMLKDDGYSPVSAGAKLVDLADQVNTARWSQMVNGFEPSLMVLLPDEVEMTADELDSVVARLQAKYGGATNHRKVMVTNGKNVVTLNTTPKDMDYTNGHKESRDAVMALLGTPPVAAGLQEAGAYAAYFASLKQFISGTCQPIFDLLGEQDSLWFGSYRRSPVYPGAMILEYQEGLTVEIEAAPLNNPEVIERELQTDIAAGAIEVDEVRAMRGRPLWGGSRGKVIAGQQTTQQPQPDQQMQQAFHNPLQPGLSQNEFLAAPSIEPASPQPDATVVSDQQVQVAADFVLNGAQITAARQIVADVATGVIPRDAGIGQLEVLFNLTNQQALRIMGAAGTQEPTTPNPVGERNGSSDHLEPIPQNRLNGTH